MPRIFCTVNGEEVDMSGYALGQCVKCGEHFIYASFGYGTVSTCDMCNVKPIETTTSYKKRPISDSDRWEVWERDNFTCQVCGSRKNLSVDHIIPESKGGANHPDNYQTLCKKCNSRKGAR